MSKLDTIKQTLADNRDIVIHRVISWVKEPRDPVSKNLHHQVIISVFPIIGTFNPAELNSLKRTLIPAGMRPIKDSDFYEDKLDLYLGELEFGEPIGKSRELLIMTDPEMMNHDGFKDGRKVIRQDLFRIITVQLLPDAVTAHLTHPRSSAKVSGTAWNMDSVLLGKRIGKVVIEAIQNGESALINNAVSV
jgi:hypothetical protein